MAQVRVVVDSGSAAVPEEDQHRLKQRPAADQTVGQVIHGHSLPGSDSFPAQDEGLFLFGQAVENLHTGVEPAGSDPRPPWPGRAAVRHAVWPGPFRAYDPVEEFHSPDHGPPHGPQPLGRTKTAVRKLVATSWLVTSHAD